MRITEIRVPPAHRTVGEDGERRTPATRLPEQSHDPTGPRAHEQGAQGYRGERRASVDWRDGNTMDSGGGSTAAGVEIGMRESEKQMMRRWELVQERACLLG